MGKIEYLANYTKVGKIQQDLYEKRQNQMENQMFQQKTSRFDVICTEFVVDSDRKTQKKDPEVRYLRAKNTTNVFKVDKEDWELAKHVAWYESGAGDLVTIKGQTYEEYVGIIGHRKYPFSPRDKRREHYHNC